ncbi:MAG: sodium/proline symporter [bacterium]|nr:sodium/proline symporter [bacterium]
MTAQLIAIGLYVAALLVIGFIASRRMHDIRDYFASGKRLGFINVAFSSRATGESAWLLLGLTGMGFAVGVQAFWVVLGEIIGVAGAWLFMAKRFKRLTDRYDSLTVPDYLESRFRDSSHWLRLIAAGALVIFVPIYAAAQVHAAGGAFYDFLGWNHYVGAAFGFAVVLLYITQGGFTAVVWSDVFQGTLMLLGLVVLPIVAFMEIGGFTNLIDSIRAINPDLLTLHGPAPANEAGEQIAGAGGWNAGSIFTVLGFIAIGIGFLGSPQVFVRFISIKSEKEINKGTLVAVTWTTLALSGAVCIGILGRAIFLPTDIKPIDPETVDAVAPTVSAVQDSILPHMAEVLLPAFFTGLFIAMVLSAIMSTIDSLLVVASSAAVRDYWQKTRHPDMSDERLVSTSRKLTVILALIAFALGIGILLYDKEQGIFWTIIFGWSGIAATFCPTIILSLFWSKLTSLGAKCAMVAGFLGVPFFKFGLPPVFRAIGKDDWVAYLGGLDVLLPSFIVGFVVAIVVSLLDKSGQAKVADAGIDLDFAKRGPSPGNGDEPGV